MFFIFFSVSLNAFCQEKIDLNVKNTGSNMTVAILEVDEKMIEKGDTLAVFYQLSSGEKKCGGFVIWNNERVALTIWGNDNTSESKDGFHAKDIFLPVYHIKNGNINNAMNSEFMAGNNFFSHNGISIIKKLY